MDVTRTPYFVPIDGTDATASFQASMTDSDADLLVPAGTSIRVNGIKIPSGRRLHMTGATLVTGSAPRMSSLETAVGATDVRIFGGHIICIEPPIGVLGGVGVRGNDCQDLWLMDLCVEGWPVDCAYVGGNVGCRKVRIERCVFRFPSRSCLSVSYAEDVVIIGCEFTDTVGDPGAGCDIEPNAGCQVSNVVVSDCISARCNVGVYVQRGKGKRSDLVAVTNCEVRDCKRAGIIVSEADRAIVYANRVSGAPIGINVGANTESMRTADATIARNVVTDSLRPLILAGVRDSQIIGNTLSGWIQMPALGVGGDMVFLRNVNSLVV